MKNSNNKDNPNTPRYSILVIDMLNDFIYGRLESPRARKIIPKIKFLLEFARRKKIPIFYCNDEHMSSDPEIKLWGLHAMKGTKVRMLSMRLNLRRKIIEYQKEDIVLLIK